MLLLPQHSMSSWVNWDSDLGLVLESTVIVTKQNILLLIPNYLRFGHLISIFSQFPLGMGCLTVFLPLPCHGRSEIFNSCIILLSPQDSIKTSSIVLKLFLLSMSIFRPSGVSEIWVKTVPTVCTYNPIIVIS